MSTKLDQEFIVLSGVSTNEALNSLKDMTWIRQLEGDEKWKTRGKWLMIGNVQKSLMH